MFDSYNWLSRKKFLTGLHFSCRFDPRNVRISSDYDIRVFWVLQWRINYSKC